MKFRISSNYPNTSDTQPGIAVTQPGYTKSDILAILLLIFLALAFMWRIVILHQVMIPIDTLYLLEPWKSEHPLGELLRIWNPNLTDEVIQGYPLYTDAINSLRAGEFLWDTSILGGMPSLARGNFALYPVFTLLGVLLPIEDALNWTKIFNLFLAGFATYMFLRELDLGPFGALTGSLAFSYNAYLISWLSLTFFFSTLVWLPVLFWGIERALHKKDSRWILLSGLGFALQILAGNFLFALFSGITLLLFSFYRSVLDWLRSRHLRQAFLPIVYAFASLACGAFLTAPQVLLTGELFLNTNRGIQVGADSYLDPKVHLVRLIAPLIYGNDVEGNTYLSTFNFPETSLYLGILPLFLIGVSLFSSRRRYAAGMLGIGLICLLAVYFPAARQVVQIIYPLMSNTFPGRIFFVIAFCLSIAAGIGADELGRNGNKAALQIGAALASALAVLIGIAAVRSPQPAGGFGIYPDSLWLPMGWSICTAVIFLFWSIFIGQRLVWKTAATVLITADLFSLGINYNSAFDRELLYPQTESLNNLLQIAAREDQPFRIVNIDSELILPGNLSKISDLQSVSGYSSWILKRYFEYINLTHQQYTSLNKISLFNCCSPLLDALNAKYVYTSAGTIPEDTGIYNLIMRMGDASADSQGRDSFGSEYWGINGNTEAVLVEIPPASLTYTIEAGEGMVFRSAVYIDPHTWNRLGKGAAFSVHISRPEEGSSTAAFEWYMNPAQKVADRYPVPVEVDLSDYRGEKIKIKLQTNPVAGDSSRFNRAGWINPRIEGYTKPSLQLIAGGENKIYENLDALPRAWIVHQVVRVPANNLQAVKKYLRNPTFNLRKKAVIEAEIEHELVERYAPLEPSPGSEVQITGYSNQQVSLQAQLAKPGVMVLSDQMYPGWKVSVDGTPRPILTANLIMRAVYLEEGDHSVVFTYNPDLYRLGLLMTILTLTAILILLFRPGAARWKQPYSRQS